MPDSPRIAAIVPCHNEELAIAKVVHDLRVAAPAMNVYVYDNASTDDTARVAREAGAIVRHEPTKGKGNVVRRAFADVDSDIYVLIGFRDRPTASESKLRTYHDGFRILSLIIGLIHHERPLLFYGVLGAIIGVLTGFPVTIDFLSTGLVPRLPTAILAVGIVVTTILTGMIGLVLDGVLKSRREFSRLNYLLHSAVGEYPPS